MLILTAGPNLAIDLSSVHAPGLHEIVTEIGSVMRKIQNETI